MKELCFQPNTLFEWFGNPGVFARTRGRHVGTVSIYMCVSMLYSNLKLPTSPWSIMCQLAHLHRGSADVSATLEPFKRIPYTTPDALLRKRCFA